MLVDSYGRPLTHLRISVTGKCNYSCIFCHREGESNTPDFLKVEHIGLVAKVAHGLGVRYFKLTGGEPLLREDIGHIVESIKNLGNVEVSVVSNGFLLVDRVSDLIKAGLDRINVSLHSLNPEVYRVITGVNGLRRVIRGLEACVDHSLPVKLNVVVLRGLNDREYVDLIDYASRRGFNISFIELIPLGLSAKEYLKRHCTLKEVEEYLEEIAVKQYKRRFQLRPVYVMPSGIRVELVKGYGNPELCLNCSRLRLTHNGKLKPCLYRKDRLLDIRPILEADMPLARKEELLEKALRRANFMREPFFKSYA